MVRNSLNKPGFFSVLIPQPGRQDFRDDAVRKSRDYMSRHHKQSITMTDESLCIPFEHRTTETRLMWHAWLTFGFLWGPALWLPCLALYYVNKDDSSIADLPVALQTVLVTLAAIGAIGFILAFREPSRLRKCVANRPDAFINDFPDTEASWIHVNNGYWYDPHKLDAIIPWDQAYMILDRENRRLIIDGFFYRYQIMAEDIERIEPVASNTSVLARIVCTIQNTPMDFLLVLAGKGTGAPTGPVSMILNDKLNAPKSKAWANHLAESIGWSQHSPNTPPPLPSISP